MNKKDLFDNKIENDETSKNEQSSKDYTERAKSGKKKWYIILGAAIAAIVIIVAFIIVPLTRQPDPVKKAEVPVPEEAPVLVEEIIPPESAQPESEQSDEENAPKEILPELAPLYEQNKYLAGWLEIPDTIIDYPVMYTPEDGEYYLYRTFDNEEDPTKEGCLFIDAHCTIDPRSTNLLIHGHNMKNGTMFHSLLDYADEEYYREHPIINYSSLWEDNEYEIVSVFRSKVYNKDDDVFKFYKFYNADNEQEFNNFIDNIKELELYDTGITAEYGDELITLATCEYTQENGRFVVVARKKG